MKDNLINDIIITDEKDAFMRPDSIFEIQENDKLLSSIRYLKYLDIYVLVDNVNKLEKSEACIITKLNFDNIYHNIVSILNDGNYNYDERIKNILMIFIDKIKLEDIHELKEYKRYNLHEERYSNELLPAFLDNAFGRLEYDIKRISTNNVIFSDTLFHIVKDNYDIKIEKVTIASNNYLKLTNFCEKGVKIISINDNNYVYTSFIHQIIFNYYKSIAKIKYTFLQLMTRIFCDISTLSLFIGNNTISINHYDEERKENFPLFQISIFNIFKNNTYEISIFNPSHFLKKSNDKIIFGKYLIQYDHSNKEDLNNFFSAINYLRNGVENYESNFYDHLELLLLQNNKMSSIPIIDNEEFDISNYNFMEFKRFSDINIFNNINYKDNVFTVEKNIINNKKKNVEILEMRDHEGEIKWNEFVHFPIILKSIMTSKFLENRNYSKELEYDVYKIEKDENTYKLEIIKEECINSIKDKNILIAKLSKENDTLFEITSRDTKINYYEALHKLLDLYNENSNITILNKISLILKLILSVKGVK